ncbi:ATP-binding protein [Acinetobacter brisouii]
MNAMTAFDQFKTVQATQICPVHKTAMIKFGPTVQCKACAIELVKQGNIEHDVAVNEMVRKNHFAGAKLPDRHAECGFKNYTVNNHGQQYAKETCLKFAKLINSGSVANLIMVGRTGTGKTHLACAIARNVLDARKFARYVTSEQMATDIADAWKKADDSEASAIYRYTEHDFLIIDEYGLHDQHEKLLQLVHKVLYARYDAKKSTMLISNWTKEQLQQSLGDRLWSRFQHDGLEIVSCDWSDARVGGKA